MKYKISLLFFLLFFIAYVMLSFLNSDKVRLEVGFGRSFETTITNYIVVSFVLGVIFSIVASFFGDARRGIARWRDEKKERERNEANEFLEKAKLYEMKGDAEKAVEYFNRVIKSSPDMEEAYLAYADMHAARGEPAKAAGILDLGEAHIGKTERIMLKKVQMHRAQQDMNAMERDLKDFLSVKEGSLEAMRALRDLYISRKSWTEALEIEEKIRKQIKTPEEDLRLAGLRYENAKEQFLKEEPRLYEQVLKDMRELTGDFKRFIPAYILSAEVYKKMGKLNDAGRVYGRGFAKTGHVIFLSQMEDLYLDKREPGRHPEDLPEAPGRRPEEPAPHVPLRAALPEAGDDRRGHRHPYDAHRRREGIQGAAPGDGGGLYPQGQAGGGGQGVRACLSHGPGLPALLLRQMQRGKVRMVRFLRKLLSTGTRST